jgi:hypothetical protein
VGHSLVYGPADALLVDGEELEIAGLLLPGAGLGYGKVDLGTKRLIGCSPAIPRGRGPWTCREQRFSSGHQYSIRVDESPPGTKGEGWMAAQDISALFLSVVNIGQLETGLMGWA